MSRGPKRRARKYKPPCPFDGKTIMSMKHALLISERDPSVEPYTCDAGYIHVGNISRRPAARSNHGSGFVRSVREPNT